MIRATLTPPCITPELTLQALRDLMRKGRDALAQERAAGRQKARRYAVYLRHRNRVKGHQEGLMAAGSRMTAVLEGLRNTYDEAVEAARYDTLAAARAIAEQVIPSKLLSDSRVFQHWVNEALIILKRSKTLQIAYHPKYHEIIQQVAQTLPSSIALSPDHNLHECEFSVAGDTGGIEFSWKAPFSRAEQGERYAGDAEC